MSSGLTKPSKQCYGRLHRPKARTETNSFHSCYLRIGRYLSPPWGSPHLNAFMGGLSEDHWTSYASLGKLQRRLMTVLYRTYCLCGISCRKCLSWRVETYMQHRAPRRSGMTRERSFQLGDQVLILLSTTANKLAAEWQRPYRIVK